ncbi:MAG: TetR/AcrR family transcriptional regulator C-terminal domain-containing protein [Coriobacteriales bacterium]|nr:TetR/AcrR family transcriptional regulator C-terminal domain-containing protein [Coriobacteriales bacterium]MBQ6585566.1 TetR/AcrR family transcriptional regulator C-terminal domain-containing protein [Coriobacteriales bacterium]
MSGARDTKRMFADELETMMERMPLSKVRVGELCARCGVERRVFYYHFKDKYDLVAWMFEQDQQEALTVGAPYTESLYAASHQRLWERRAFYRRAFEEDTQNSIRSYLLEFSTRANELALKRYLAVNELSRDRLFMARHFAHGNIGCVIDWLQGKLQATPAQLAAYMFAGMPRELREAYAYQQD